MVTRRETLRRVWRLLGFVALAEAGAVVGIYLWPRKPKPREGAYGGVSRRAPWGTSSSALWRRSPRGSSTWSVYQGVYADGSSAAASQRAWTNKFIYATYGSFEIAGGYTESDWIAEASEHGFNNIQMNFAPIGAYMNTSGGEADALAHGYGYTILDPAKLCDFDPDMWFLNDEPDAQESNQAANHCGTGAQIPCDYHRYPGTLVMYESVQRAADVRAQRPNVPTTVNLDGAEEPYSFYDWGPSLDILQTDNYYEPRMKGAYQVNFNRIPLYANAKLSYAIGRTACAWGRAQSLQPPPVFDPAI